MERKLIRNPWAWVPTLYFAEGIPYVVVMTVSVIFYKRMGISNTDIALYTSWLYLPWVLKPLWSPIIDMLRTKRIWIITMQLIVGAGLAGVGLTIPVPDFFRYTLIFFWLLAFSSATHDIAADGFYMLGLSEHDQAYFVGIRSTFYRFAMLTGQGLLVILAGYFEVSTGLNPVRIEVTADPAITERQLFTPYKISSGSTSSIELASSTGSLKIGTNLMEKETVTQVIDTVRKWNQSNGFYQVTSYISEKKKDHGPSWWKVNIGNHIDHFIRSNFGEKQKVVTTESISAGNLGLVYFNLSKIPENGKNIVVNVVRRTGDKSIGLAEGTRFVFNSSNWDKPACAIFQLDPKLDRQSVARFEIRSGNIPLAWSLTFFILATLFLVFFVYHRTFLPYPVSDKSVLSDTGKNVLKEFFSTFSLYFKKENIGVTITFLLIYRMGEAQLLKLAAPFLLDTREEGGLALTTGDIGIVYGTVGIIALTVGGLLGGFVAAKKGLKFWLWWMALAINIPHLMYVYLSYAQPEDYFTIGCCVALEQLGYGFGFTAYMLYMIYISEGTHKTAHFAISTAFMAMSMMIPGMWSGWLQELIGYKHFFVWVVLCTIPCLIIVKFLKIDPKFGTRETNRK